MKGIKFSQKKPVILTGKLQSELYFLRKEFEQLLLIQAVVESYCNPCDLTKYNIYKSKP